MGSPMPSPGNSPTSGRAIALQWSLNQTANSMVQLSIGLLKAITSDNVPALAAITAHNFGETLAVCQETQTKMEREAKKSHPTYTVKFLQSTIGYAKDDCAYELASSSGGLRFLGLAATVVCTRDLFNAARALSAMITTSAAGNQLSPTVVQIQELLRAIEYKVNRAGFADLILGWEAFLADHALIPYGLRAHAALCTDHPSIDVLEKLVSAFRNLMRIGTASSVVITAGSCCPWIIAFTKWCLGTPPHVLLLDGTRLLDQPESKVTILVSLSNIPSQSLFENIHQGPHRDNDIRIEIYHELDDPKDIWSMPSQRERWSGMVTLDTFGQRTLREFFVSRDNAVMQAIPYCLGSVARDFRIDRSPKTDTNRISIFPNINHLYAILARFLNIEYDPGVESKQFSECTAILELPIVGQHLRHLAEICGCSFCLGTPLVQPNDCKVLRFHDLLSRLTADILALSLFDTVGTVDPMLFYLGRLISLEATAKDPFVVSVKRILFKQKLQIKCSAKDILHYALSLAGHDVRTHLASGLWVASEARGQVLYPMLLDTLFLDRQGVLQLGGGSGKLQHKGQTWPLVLGQPEKSWRNMFTPRQHRDNPVDRLCNLFGSEKVHWAVTEGDKHLVMLCGTTTSPKTFNPFTIVDTASRSLYVASCQHRDKTMETVSPVPHAYFVTPTFVEDKPLEPGSAIARIQAGRPVGVIPSFDSNPLRLFALAGGVSAAIRGPSACLQCAIDTCHGVGLSYCVL